MMKGARVIAILILFAATILANEQGLGSISFNGPFRPNSATASIDGWDILGSTVVTKNYIRLTPDSKNSRGLFSNPNSVFVSDFELSFQFKIHSSNAFGADGAVLWLTEAPVEPGKIFGAASKWKGIAIVLDTYDNNAADPHPWVSIHANDGTHDFQFEHDGDSTHLGGCNIDYRHKLVTLYFRVEKGIASLFVDRDGDGNWEKCASNIAVKIPEKFYFSFSAATGGLSDFHDIYSFNINSLKDSGSNPRLARPPQAVLEGKPIPAPVEGCVISSTCTNLKPLIDATVASLEEVEEQMGHQLVTMQNAVTDSVKQIESKFPELDAAISTRKNELVALNDKLKGFLTNVNYISESPKTSSTASASQLKAVVDTLNTLQRTLVDIQKDQKDIVQTLDVQREALQVDGESAWGVIAFLLCLVQVAISIFGCYKQKKSAKNHFRF